MYWLVYILTLFAGVMASVATLKWVRRRWQNSITQKNIAENITISLLTLFLTFMAAEMFFAFFAQTDNQITTLAARNWLNYYWVLNSMGYRDIEWAEQDLTHKRKILVLGDSLAEGYGIKNVEDRFSNILAQKLNSDYIVMNMAIAGLNTRGQIERIKGFPYKPEILIYQYYINDIEDAARERGVRLATPNSHPWPIFEPLIKNSYAINFIYWRTVRLGPRTSDKDYLTLVQEAYNDPGIWWIHQQELLTILTGADSEKVKVIAIVFPALTDVKRSREITSKVVAFFEDHGVATLDVADMIENVPPERLVVNPFDAHPNEWVHEQVADKLYEMVIKWK